MKIKGDVLNSDGSVFLHTEIDISCKELAEQLTGAEIGELFASVVKPQQKECSCNPHGYPHASAIQKDEDGNEICMWCRKELNPAKPIPEKNECTCQIGTGLNGICIMCGKPDNTGNRGTTYYGFFKTKPISHRKVEQIKYNDDLYKDGNIQMCIDKLNEVISVINGGGE